MMQKSNGNFRMHSVRTWLWMGSYIGRNWRAWCNSENLRKLNAIVHPAVIADIKKWSVAEQKDLVFVETAILRESGMETLVDEVWVVDAPKDIRVARVMVRNNMPEEDVRKRIDSQNDNPKFSVPTSVVENYGSNSVIVQVQNLLKTMFNKQNTK